MSNLEQLLCSWSRIGLLRARLGLIAAALPLLSCSNAHVEGSTETGNPPVIRVDKISLVVANDSVRIVGQAGAISPGGVAVEVTIVGTNEVVRGTSKPDGSFDVALTTSTDTVVEVRAADGDKRSGVVYVTQGGASVGTGADAALSCMQRTNLASQAVGSAANRADTSCQSAADCKLVSNKTACTDSCGDLLVSSSAAASFQSAVVAVDEGLCAEFASDGCQVIANPCVPPPNGPIECVAGQCRQSFASCPTCLNTQVSWGPSSGLSTNAISGCDDYARTSRTGPGCTGKVAHCSNSGGSGATIEQFFTALADPDVEQALSSGSTVGGPPAPGGMSTNVAVAGRSFLISNCGSGPNCSPIPSGVQRLRQLLDEVASETQCEP